THISLPLLVFSLNLTCDSAAESSVASLYNRCRCRCCPLPPPIRDFAAFAVVCCLVLSATLLPPAIYPRLYYLLLSMTQLLTTTSHR
ncbi:hypothetical protein GW17_00040514, partial [Ensete ventricosum]